MHRQTLLVSTLAVLMAGAAARGMAQHAPPPPPAAPAMPSMHGSPGTRHAPDMWHHRSHDLRGGVIGDLRELDRLYMMAGRSKNMAAVYNEVLARSQEPRVRDYAYRQLARLQARPTNVDQAIATLRKGLDESLANEAKMRAEREKMRDAWKRGRADTDKPSTAQ